MGRRLYRAHEGRQAMADRLPVPDFFDATRVGDIWSVPYAERVSQALDWRHTHDVKPAATDRVRVALMGVDLQNTFCVPSGELFVAGRSGNGAVEDSARICRFIYQNLRHITRIFLTMDTHQAMQIFHPVYWVD